jgi:hypothetical protein
MTEGGRDMVKLGVAFHEFVDTHKENQTPVVHSLDFHIHITASHKENNEI